MMKTSTLTAILCLLSMALFAQPGAGYRPGYRFLHSDEEVADKDFYLFTAIGQSPQLTRLLKSDDTLNTNTPRSSSRARFRRSARPIRLICVTSLTI